MTEPNEEKKEMTPEEIEEARKLADEKLEELVNTPITKEDAEKTLAECDLNRMQLAVVRQKWSTQITQLQMRIAALDEQMLAIDMERALVFRRSLNKAPDAEK